MLQNTDVWDDWIKDRAFEAANEIGALNTTIPVEKTLCIENFRTKLPCGFIRFDQPRSIEVTSESGCIYPEYIEGVLRPRVPNSAPRNVVQRIGKYLVFGTDITAAECKLLYMSAYLDDNDKPVIPAKFGRCIRAYCVQEYGAINENLVSGRQYELARATWTQGSAQMRGEAAMLDAQTRRVLYRIMNSIW